MQDKTNRNSKIIQHLRKVQFITEFFILSKVSEDHHAVPEVLMIIEALKFFFKSAAVAESKGIYLESAPVGQEVEDRIEALREQKSTEEEEVERQKNLLTLIKQKPYEGFNLYPKVFETLANGKKMQLLNAVKIPNQLKKVPLKFRHILGEFLYVLRPLISIICIRLYGIDNYKSYFISLVMDLLIILLFQRGLIATSEEEKAEIQRRKSEMISRYLFRRPFFLLLKRMVLEPLLGKLIKPQRAVYKLIMSLLEMQSSISLTL